jgi:hypothetical protein
MDPRPIELHPRAIAEARAAREWYADRSPAAAEAFMAELDLAIDRMANENLAIGVTASQRAARGAHSATPSPMRPVFPPQTIGGRS